MEQHDDDDGEFLLLFSKFMHTAMAAPLIFVSGPARSEAALHGCGTSLVCLVYAIAFQLCHGGDMMHEMRRKHHDRISQSATLSWQRANHSSLYSNSKSWCWRPGLPVEQNYKISSHYRISVATLI